MNIDAITRPTLVRISPSAEHAAQHRRLARFNQKRLRPGHATSNWRAELPLELEMREFEADFVEDLRRSLAPRLAGLPTDAQAFMAWFEALQHTGPGQNDSLFDWLETTATRDEMRWFLTQEITGEAGFDDLVALTQIRLPAQAKLELARNYWDEMGRGHAAGMHGPMLERVARALSLEPTIDGTVWESLALGNLMSALAINRRYAYHSVGALGVIEMTAPGRVSKVNAGLKRLGVAARARVYFQVHAGLDVKHSEAWNREAILPLVAADPSLARPIAEGALLRLHCGARCFERYRWELGMSVKRPVERDVQAA